MAEPAARPRDSFAVYLVKSFMARKSYRPDLPGAARALEDTCDYALLQGDGYGLKILCVRAAGGKGSLPTRDALLAIGHGLRAPITPDGKDRPAPPVLFQIMEIDGGGSEKQPIKLGPGINLHVYHIDTGAGKIASNLPLNGALAESGFIGKLLRAPRLEDAALHRLAEPAAFVKPTRPWLTYTLLALMAAAFVAEILFALGPLRDLIGLDSRTLVALGAANKKIILVYGEGWRLVTAAFLHGNIVHLLLNGLALLCGGVLLENILGRVWFAGFFTLGLIGGGLMGLAFNSDQAVVVGASGAVMALFALIFICSRRFAHGRDRAGLQRAAMGVLIPSMLPIAVGGLSIDVAGHIGGMLAGALGGAALFACWPRRHARPPAAWLAWLVTFAGAATLLYGVAMVLTHYRAFIA